MISCPNCNGEKFEGHLVGGLEMKAEMPEMVNVVKFFTCVECEYVIAQPSDLRMSKVTIYVLGESLSKQRQGLKHLIDEGILQDKSGQIEDAGGAVVFSQDQSIKLFGYFQFPGGWVFTKPTWKIYEATPDFPLAEGPHKTDVKVLY